ncbi:hypothetical protein PTKIN_Ptkin06aG0183800 [Pterospermum kingtungense]
MAICFFSSTVPTLWRPPQWKGLREASMQRPHWRHNGSLEAKHLLGLVHDHWLPPPQEELRINMRRIEPSELLCFSSIRSATELIDVGITFKKHRIRNSLSESLFDIRFENGHMHIPTLTVDHDTEPIFRNLIAYEQQSKKGGGCSFVMDYARLMNGLINYGDDVALLSDCGIIDNRLGTNEEVTDMFNKLNDYVYLSPANFYYTQLFYDVNEHCNRPWNRWKVKLRQKYFNTPWDWALTSIVAATILLLLTFVQTLYTVLSYYYKN